MVNSMIYAAKFLVHMVCTLLAFPFRLVAFLLFVACVLSWITISVGLSDLAVIIMPIIGIVCDPLRPLLPWGGIVPLGNGNLYLDLAPIPASILISIPARILMWVRDWRMFELRSSHA